MITIALVVVSALLDVGYLMISTGIEMDGTVPDFGGKTYYLFVILTEITIACTIIYYLLSKFKKLKGYCLFFIIMAKALDLSIKFQETYLIPQYIVDALLYLTIIAFLSMIIFGRLKEK